MAVMTTRQVTSQADIDLIVHANHWNPFSVLGLHELPGGTARLKEWVVRAFLPEARTAWVVDLPRGEPGVLVPMERIHPDGFFEAVFPDRAEPFPYRLKVENHEGHSWEFVDPYRFGPVLTDFDLHLLGEGTHYRNYERLGAHLRTHEGFRGVHFAVWAPNAERVSVIGNFNHWDGRRHPMRNRGATGIWELFIPDLCEGEVYKFEIKSRHDGYLVAEVRPLRLRRRAAAQDGVGRLGRHQVRLERRGMDGEAGRAAGPRPADRHLRGPPRLLEARAARRRPASSTTASWPTTWSRTSSTPTSPTSS